MVETRVSTGILGSHVVRTVQWWLTYVTYLELGGPMQQLASSGGWNIKSKQTINVFRIMGARILTMRERSYKYGKGNSRLNSEVLN